MCTEPAELTQKCSIPSFFLNSTTALHHSDWLGYMAPASNMSQSEACTSSSSSGGICLNQSLNGSLLVIQISCSTMLVQPSSFPSNMKTSWKDNTRSHAAMAFQGVQSGHPDPTSLGVSAVAQPQIGVGAYPPPQGLLPPLGISPWVGQVTWRPPSAPTCPSSGRLQIQTCFLPPQTPYCCSS